MKIKLLSFAILSSLFLTACGGGDNDNIYSSTGNGSSEGNTNVANETEWYSYETGNSTQDVNLYSKLKFTFKNNSIYVSNEYSTDGKTNLDVPEFLSSYLANDGLYDVSKTKTDVGYRMGSLISKTATVWTFTPNSSSNLSNLKLTEKFDVVDLSGKSISEFINGFDHFTGSNSALNSSVGTYPAYYVQKLKGKTFPTGATCLRSTSSSTNTDFAVFSAEKPNVYNLENYFNNGYTTTSLGNYSLYLSKDIEPNWYIDAVVKMGNGYYSAEYSKLGEYYTLAAQVKEYEQDYKDEVANSGQNSLNSQIEKAYLDGLKSECSLFNKTASVAIDAVK